MEVAVKQDIVAIARSCKSTKKHYPWVWIAVCWVHHAPPAIWKSSIHPLASLHILQVHIDYWLSQDARVKGDLSGICARIAYFCSAGPLWWVVVLVPFGQHCHAWTTGSYEIIDDPAEYVLIYRRVWYPWTFASEPGISGREPFMNRLYNPVALPEPVCRERLCIYLQCWSEPLSRQPLLCAPSRLVWYSLGLGTTFACSAFWH